MVQSLTISYNYYLGSHRNSTYSYMLGVFFLIDVLVLNNDHYFMSH